MSRLGHRVNVESWDMHQPIWQASEHNNLVYIPLGYTPGSVACDTDKSSVMSYMSQWHFKVSAL